MTSSRDNASHRLYLKELLLNQIWQSANFLSKGGFLILLTPLMLLKWSRDGYGLFALSSSLLVSMALLDGGVRSLTRLRLAEGLATGDDASARRAFGEGLFTFSIVVVAALVLSAGLALTGTMERLLNLPPGGALVLVITVAMTGLMMITLLALEPVAARGNLSSVKASNTIGAVVAIPVCGGAVWFGAPVLVVVILYSICLILPNLWLIVRLNIFDQLPRKGEAVYTFEVLWRTLHSGLWYYLTTVAMIIKSHLLTFVVSAMAGPAEAGIFYIVLRVTEIVGNVGATASETSLASLASAPTPADRGARFRHSWCYVSIFCLQGSWVLAFAGEPLLRLWLPEANIVSPTGAGMALFGLAGAFSRVVVNASMGLGIVRDGAIGNLAEALIDVAFAAIGFHLGGIPGLLIGGSIGILAMLPVASKIAGLCAGRFVDIYLFSLSSIAAGLGGSLAVQILASFTPNIWLKFAAIGVTGGVSLWQLRRIHSPATPPPQVPPP